MKGNLGTKAKDKETAHEPEMGDNEGVSSRDPKTTQHKEKMLVVIQGTGWESYKHTNIKVC